MLIKIINYRRKTPRRPGDLRRLIRYLFLPKLSTNSSADRLLGPPELHNLLVSARPSGTEIGEAADDLTEQFVRYCRLATAGQDKPNVWYVHFIFSFAAATTPKLAFPPDTHVFPERCQSIAKNAIRIAKDALDPLGWGATQPSLFVAHGDRAHVHVHAVIAIPVFGGKNWDVMRFSRKHLNECAQVCAEVFGLPTKILRVNLKKWEN